jgi:putative ubiquitin-RnfH superfamily antitoxin RatB of RatAB toxin-antitoxin module
VSEQRLDVEVVYALPERCWRWVLRLAPGARVADALAAAELADAGLPPGVLPAVFGIYGREVRPDTPLQQGDRVEIYRPLTQDPRHVRRQRVERERARRQR